MSDPEEKRVGGSSLAGAASLKTTSGCDNCERMKTMIEMLIAPPDVRYVLRLYSELNLVDRQKIDTLMDALKGLKISF